MAGVVSAVIVFAMLFTAGASYFAYVTAANHTSDQALAGRNAQLQQATLENLSLRAKLLLSGDIWLSVNNTGGVPATLVNIYLTDPSGKVISGYLDSTVNGLNVTLPLTLPAGASSSMTSGCGTTIGCDIKIHSSSGLPSRFLVSVLTKAGNVFSVLYPAPTQITEENVVQANGLEQVYVNQSLVDVINPSVVIGCYACSSSFEGGGEILLLEISALPSPVSSGATVTVTATVYDESAYPATGVNVSIYAVGQSAYATPSTSQSSPITCATTETVPAEGSLPFSCNFKAYLQSGSSLGTITFEGSASGSISLDGGQTEETVNSGTSSSNPVQVGTTSFGPFQLNYYYFDYTSKTCTPPTYCSPAVISHSTTYDAFYVQVTNTYSAPLSILDGSYLQFVSPGTDLDEYVVNSVSYSGSTPTIAAYSCFGAPGSPLGGTCTTLQPGGTATFIFAASGADGTGWEWGSGGNPGGDTGVGQVVQIIMEYAIMSGSTVSSVGAQNSPFQAVYIS